MKDLTKTASILDRILRILSVAIRIGAVGCLVGLAIIAAALIFDLPPQMIGTGFGNVDLGFMTLTVAESDLPEIRPILGWAAVKILLSFMCLLIGGKMTGCFRGILAPMKVGAPFRNTVSRDLKKLAKYICILGVAVNVQDIASNLLMERAYNLSNIMLNGQFTHVTINNVFDLSFLFVAAILLLLSFVFRYGEELQQLSDETL